MPIQAKGRFPKPSTTYRDGGGEGSYVGVKPTIEEYRALKDMPRGDEALKLLRSVGMAVKPIMIKHRWKLPLLVEIYPKQQSLLGFNVNAGRKIALRLRHATNHNDFLDEDSIIETMLHELAHNLRGPHDDTFFQHLDTLTREWYELQKSSSNLLPGQGFLSGGVRLGGSRIAVGQSLDPVMARQRAADMAERRRRMAELMEDRAGRRVGGKSAASSASLAATRAEAAERRRNITSHCPSSNVQETQIAAKEQEEQELLHGIQVITINDDGDDNVQDNVQNITGSDRLSPVLKREQKVSSSDDDDLIVVQVKKASKRAKLATPSSHLVNQTRAAAALRHDLLAGASGIQSLQQAIETPISANSITTRSRGWNCQRCTLRNPSTSLVCEACDDIRPGLEHWICTNCQHRMLGDDAQYWCCVKCSQIKTA